MNEKFSLMKAVVRNFNKHLFAFASNFECLEGLSDNSDGIDIRLRNIRISKEEYYMDISIGLYPVEAFRYYLDFADGSCFSFRLSSISLKDIKSYNFTFFATILALELESAILIDDELMLRAFNDWLVNNEITMSELKWHIIHMITTYGVEKTIRIVSKYKFFSFKQLVEALQKRELYDVLAEVLDVGNRLGFVGVDEASNDIL